MSNEEASVLKQVRSIHRRVALWYCLAIGYVWIIIQAAVLVLLVPLVAENYDDLKLPRATKLLVDASRWMAGDDPSQSFPGWYLAVPAALVLLTALALALRRATALLAFIPILAVASLVAQIVLLLAPLYQLGNTLTP